MAKLKFVPTVRMSDTEVVNGTDHLQPRRRVLTDDESAIALRSALVEWIIPALARRFISQRQVPLEVLPVKGVATVRAASP